MSVRDVIVEKLSAKFAPTHLEVIDDSERHRGHAGWHEGGESHFRVRALIYFFMSVSCSGSDFSLPMPEK